jgi:hypothetical protein
LINLKFHDAVKTQQAAEERAQQQSASTLTAGGLFSGFSGSISSKIKNSLFGGLTEDPHGRSDSRGQQQQKNEPEKKKAQTMRISKVLAQNIIFNTLSQFVGHFVNLKLPFQQSRELLMHFCKKYELDQSRTHLLLSELESVQKNTRFAITWKEVKEISDSQREKRLSKFGNESRYLALGMVVKYCFRDQELANLLLVSKQSYNRLRMPVYKQALLYSQPERLGVKRIGIWKCIMNLNRESRDYQAFK